MDQNTLVIRRELSQDMALSGRKLLENLRGQNIPIRAAMWFFESDYYQWKYILVSEGFYSYGSSIIYEKISQLNRETPFGRNRGYKAIPLNYIVVTSTNSRIYRSMEHFFNMQNTYGDYRISNTMINGLEIDDCLIYQL